ncbi:MAG: hypothetical protein QGI21_07025 [Candidatus Poseidoniaceae archaeon]|jgi:hypothetical protein|nr:hypothetical protein [Candidatus Poseidoniaceae archaeon]
MVDTVTIKRVGIRDYLSIDIEVWMNDPDDWDFKPLAHIKENSFSISSASSGKEMARVELDDEQMEAAERDRQVELRVKFGVHGMHGRLTDIHPIIADGKAKKLANSNWKTVQPIDFS